MTVRRWGRACLLAQLSLLSAAVCTAGCASEPGANAGVGQLPQGTTQGTLTQASTQAGASTGQDFTSSSTPTQGGASSTSTSTQSGATTPGPDPKSCEPGKIRCGLTCIDPLFDQDYCGAAADCIGANAGRACLGVEQCSNGQCACPSGWVRCAGACINPLEDEAFCGAKLDCSGANAGQNCGKNRVCEDGQCTSGCKAGEIPCDGTCIDPMRDFNYCGAKLDCAGANQGKTCAIGQVCSDGACKLTCKAGEVLCGHRCVNPLVDNAYCGASSDCAGPNAGAVCSAPESCVDGTCGLYCNPWQTKCDNECINGQSDPAHCGAKDDCTGANAGIVCAANEICSRGACVQAGCDEVDFKVDLPKSDVMLVLDKSGSMSQQGISGAATRWAALHDVVTQLVADYPDKVRFGLKLYPAKNAVANDCSVTPGVEVQISDASNAQILPNMPGRDETVFGETPTATGLTYAVTHATKVAARTNHPTAVMLIADGGMTAQDGGVGDSCNGETMSALLNAANNSRANGVPIFSVGIALDAPARSMMEQVAGGAENYIAADNKAELTRAMNGILAKIPNCKVPLAAIPQYHELMTVRTSDGSSNYDAPWRYAYADCAAVSAANLDRGFVYVKRSGPYDEIELCGRSCEDFKATASVDIRQNCPPPP